MLLSENEIPDALERARAAFPRFGDWRYCNEVNEDHAGFTLWGEFVPEPGETMPRRFFVTFDAYEGAWRGTLSIGQHAYFWSSADAGDAILLVSGPRASLEEAIDALKTTFGELFSTVVGPAGQAADLA